MEGGNTLLMVSANDLKEFAESIFERAFIHARETEKEEVLLTEDEVQKILNVTHSTLWRWNNTGYLHYQKAGRRNLWKKSDIEKLMNR